MNCNFSNSVHNDLAPDSSEMDNDGCGVVLVKDSQKSHEGRDAGSPTYATADRSEHKKDAPYLIAVMSILDPSSPSPSAKSTQSSLFGERMVGLATCTLSTVVDTANEKITIFVKQADTAYHTPAAPHPHSAPMIDVHLVAPAQTLACPPLVMTSTAFFPGGSAS